MSPTKVLRYAIDLALAYEAKLFVRYCVGSSHPADEAHPPTAFSPILHTY
jgi:hypothetical protein